MPHDYSVFNQKLQEFKDEQARAGQEPLKLSEDGKLDVGKYLTHYGVEFKVKANGEWIGYVLSKCLFDSSHSGGEASIRQRVNGLLVYQCFHDSCQGRTWKEARELISGEDKLGQFMIGGKSFPMTPNNAPTMADLREYIDFNISEGQFFTAEEVCRGLGAYTRDHKKHVYTGLSRLAEETVIKRDKYKYGGFRKPLRVAAYDMAGEITVARRAGVELPLDLHKLIKFEHNQLASIAGRYDAGKSSFLYHTMLLNYHHHKVVHFSSPEWDQNAIKQRMDELGIERPHPNILCYPLLDGYEDLIPTEPCIVLVDYIRTNDSPYEIDRQFYRILQNLHGGVAFAAIQKHPGLDKPTGGQFAVHAPHHVILLDKLKEGNAYICKIFKTKSEKDLEGYFRVFGFKEGRRLIPLMESWKKGEIKWEKPKDNDDNNANDDNKKDVGKRGGTYTDIDIKREKKEESTKEEKRERIPGCTNAKAKSVYERQMYSNDNNDNIIEIVDSEKPPF